MNEPRASNELIPAALAGLQEILARARRGDVAVLPELREALEARPEIWKHCSDLAAIAERAWIALVAGPDLLVAESLMMRMADLRAELAGPDPTALERLAIERVVIAWLQAWYSDLAAAGSGDVPPKVAAFALERQDRAQKRYLAALATLARIRRLTPKLGAAARDGEHRRPTSLAGNAVGTTGLVPSRRDAGAHPLSIVSVDDRDAIALDE
jgi:hypothetical protein